MPGQPIEFPLSTAPSRNPTENGGRLINAYAEKAPDGSRSGVIWRRAPGLTEYYDVSAGENDPRGALNLGGVLYFINGTKAYTLAGSTLTQLTGTVPGEGPVMMARNMKSPTPQILVVTSNGMVSLSASTVSTFSDADLPAVNSICWMDGYFVVTSAAGLAYSSAVNDTGFASTDYVTAEASIDGLKRAVSFGRNLLLMGDASIEFWSNVGNATGFPFTRGHVENIGLLSTYAVAGMEVGFPLPLMWVGNDRSVYQLQGYTPQKVSSSHLDRLIGAVPPSTLEASVYVADGHACWVLSCDEWTWVYDIGAGAWHERKSVGRSNWRARFGVNLGQSWLAFERGTGKIHTVDASSAREGSAQLIWEVRSKQIHRFPGRMVCNRVSFDFETGVGIDHGIYPIETNPRVSISWSDDGGVTFGNPLLRDLGTQGEQRAVDVWRTGLTGRNGRQWRLQVSDPVEVALLGGAVDTEPRAA